jgi:hypothetical protein
MKKLYQAIDRQMDWQATMASNYAVMKLAFVEELGEWIASTGYADWKKSPRDEHNLVVEAVDMMIFTINMAYYEDAKIHLPEHKITLHSDKSFVDYLLEALSNFRYGSILMAIASYLPETVDLLIAKQALNSLRQNYGYKKGDYIKAWPKGEDNVYLEGLTGMDFTELYELLEEIYTTKVVTQKLFVE